MIKSALALGLVVAAVQSCTAAAPAPAPKEPQANIGRNSNDTCGKAEVASYIGKSKDLLPKPPAGAVWRVTCTTCPVTMDYSEKRLNILFDQASGIIKEIKCG